MIAAVEFTDKICIVRWVGRVRLSARIVTYCGEEADASDGTIQVPDRFFVALTPVASTMPPARQVKPCAECAKRAQ